MTQKEFHNKILQILTLTQNQTGWYFDEALRKIEVLIKLTFKSTKSSDVWYHNRALKKQIESILKESTGKIIRLSEVQIKTIWELSEKYNDDIVFDKLLKATGAAVAAGELYRYLNRILPEEQKHNQKIKVSRKSLKKIIESPRNIEAVTAFFNRKHQGLNLSERVWRIMDEGVMMQIESHLAQGIATGKSAEALGRELKPYLQNPESLFRRIRDAKSGKLKLSIAAKKYEPGQGVYRSARKNALRLAASEVNFAYRTADFERWGRLDFIIGIKVQRSNSNRGDCVLCDPLAGVYPIDFRFIGWHPWCICFATPILMKEDDFMNHITGGEVHVEEVQIPNNFKKWVVQNKEKLKAAKSLPYFVKYNKKQVDGILKKC